VTALEELQRRRDHECRLTPDRALSTLDDAEAFLRERGLLTRTADCALPSLHEACHEEPYRPGAGGFGSWSATKWRWGFELPARPGVFELKIHRGKTLFLDEEAAALADPVIRSETERLTAADERWARLLDHLDGAGPSLLEDLQLELGLRPKELKALRAPLERCGAVVSRPVGETSELARWDHVFPSPAGGDPDLGPLVAAAVRAAVLAPEDELRRWFSWSWRWEAGLVDRLAAEGAIVRPGPGWVAAP
jgi:hypothetical protein